MSAVVCAAATACHSRHGMPPPMPQYFLVQLKPVGFRRWRLARMAAGGAMMVVARVPLTSFYRGLETFNGLATPFGGLIASSCGRVAWQPSTGVC